MLERVRARVRVYVRMCARTDSIRMCIETVSAKGQVMGDLTLGRPTERPTDRPTDRCVSQLLPVYKTPAEKSVASLMGDWGRGIIIYFV